MSWRILLAGLLLGAAFPSARWIAGGEGLSRTPHTYYADLTEAFLAGQLHLKQKPDPRLLALANPYAGDQGVPRPWDVSYFNQRFYLCFSAAPVLLLLAPVRLLTGYYLPDGFAAVIFGLVGYVLGAWWLLRQQRRLSPALGGGWIMAGLAIWCFCSQTQALAYADSMYVVPISAAFACLVAAFVLCHQAWEHPTRLRWLVAGGLAWGLAIACRPNYLFSVGGLAAFLFGTWWRNRPLPPEQRRGFLHLALALGLPVALIGAALMAYNWARFGSVTEFGHSYQLIAGDQRNFSQLTLGRIPTNFLPTLFRSMDYSTYFPFAIPGHAGAIATSPLLLASLALPWLWFRSRPEERPFWRIVGSALLLAGAGNLLTVCMLLTQEFRYHTDYLPALVLLTVLVSWRLVAFWRERRGPGPLAGRILLGLAATITLFHAAALNFTLINLPQRAPTLARWLNQPTHWIETALGHRYGLLQLQGRLPPAAPGTLVPLVVTGRGQDVLYLRHTGPNQVQFGFFHAGAGGLEAEPVEVDLTVPHRFTIDLGSLYPPPEHPLSGSRDPRAAKRLRQRVRVLVDDTTVLDGTSDFHPTHPLDLQIGRNRQGLVTGAARLDLSGLQVRHLGIPAAPPVARFPLKPLRLELSFPPFVHRKNEPLLCTGRPHQGDLLYVIYTGPNQLRLAHDSEGVGSVESMIIDYEPGRFYTLDVDLGSLHPAEGRTRIDGLLKLRLDGQPVLTVPRQFYPSEAVELAFGHNAIESGTVYQLFTGHIRKIEPLDPTTESPRTYGALRCMLTFTEPGEPRSDPLVTTGRTGAGDIVYVTYAGTDGIRFGFDHWGAGGPVSALIPVAFNQPAVVEISMGSLWPADLADPAWGAIEPARRRELQESVVVKVDGQIVLLHHATTHPSTPAQVEVGANPIGGSTCGASFSGRILQHERVVP